MFWKIFFFLSLFYQIMCWEPTSPPSHPAKEFSSQEILSPALRLVVPQRGDLMAKYIYAKHREWNVAADFGLKVYYNHLWVWNNFWEDFPPKRNFQDFVESFNVLLDSIKKFGYDSQCSLVPIDIYGRICGGAHRVSACLLYGREVCGELIAKDSNCLCPDWSLSYFRQKGLEEKYLDAMALQYCELKPNTYVFTIFPSAVGCQKKLEKILKSYGQIVYFKEIFFTEAGGWNFVLHAYEGEEFILNRENAFYKANLCFPRQLITTNPARVYLVEAGSLDEVKKCKALIRRLFTIGDHSVHATDTHKQAVLLARALFNKNSLHFLNNKKPIKFNNFSFLFDQYRYWLEANKKNQEWFCIDSSAVLAAYGLRDCLDLDYIHFASDSSSLIQIPGIDSHNTELHYHALGRDSILFDPDNYFYYKGIKFCSLQTIRAMKINRGEPKDLVDIALIDKLFSNSL